jgi:hypothetical protein
MAYVLRRVGRGGYVAPVGSRTSYVPSKDRARRYATREAASADCCGNEAVEPAEGGR